MPKRQLFDHRPPTKQPTYNADDIITGKHLLRVSEREWKAIRRAAKKAGESLNGYIRSAVGDRVKGETK